MKRNITSALLFSMVLVGAALFSSSTIYAQWTGPSATPPNGNVAAPINVSGTEQFKAPGGSIGADTLTGFQLLKSDADITADNNITAENQMRSNEYCDVNGQNCFTADQAANGNQGNNQAPGQNKNVKLQFSQSTLKAALGKWGGFYTKNWQEESQIDNYDPVDVTNEDFSFCFLTRKDAGSAIILAGSTYTSCNLEQNTNGNGWKLQALVDPKFLANAKVVCEASCITIGE